MQTTFIYRMVPHYFNALRLMLGKVGRKKLLAYEDARYRRVGFKAGGDVHCLDISILRRHYELINNSKGSPTIEAGLYLKDMSRILKERDNLAN